MRINEEENKDFSSFVDEDKGVGRENDSELRNGLFHVSQVGLGVFWIPCSCKAASVPSVKPDRVTENK